MWICYCEIKLMEVIACGIDYCGADGWWDK